MVQMLTSGTRERGMGKEVWVASLVLRVRTRPECPKDNPKELERQKN